MKKFFTVLRNGFKEIHQYASDHYGMEDVSWRDLVNSFMVFAISSLVPSGILFSTGEDTPAITALFGKIVAYWFFAFLGAAFFFALTSFFYRRKKNAHICKSLKIFFFGLSILALIIVFSPIVITKSLVGVAKPIIKLLPKIFNRITYALIYIFAFTEVLCYISLAMSIAIDQACKNGKITSDYILKFVVFFLVFNLYGLLLKLTFGYHREEVKYYEIYKLCLTLDSVSLSTYGMCTILTFFLNKAITGCVWLDVLSLSLFFISGRKTLLSLPIFRQARISKNDFCTDLASKLKKFESWSRRVIDGEIELCNASTTFTERFKSSELEDKISDVKSEATWLSKKYKFFRNNKVQASYKAIIAFSDELNNLNDLEEFKVKSDILKNKIAESLV